MRLRQFEETHAERHEQDYSQYLTTSHRSDSAEMVRGFYMVLRQLQRDGMCIAGRSGVGCRERSVVDSRTEETNR